MSNPRRVLSVSCAVLLVCAAAAGDASKKASAPVSKTSSKPAATTSKSAAPKTSSKTRKSRRRVSRRRGQQKIDAARTREIQEALIRERYLTGKPSGAWDSATQQAMRRYQDDNGWQTKSFPDSRALIKLGLGPDHQHLLNPESAMTTAPISVSAAPKDSLPASGNPPQ